MPGTNDFLTYATGVGAQVMSQANYAAAAPQGSVPGIADQTFANKSWRQAAAVANVIGALINAQTGQNVVDDGNQATLLANLTLAIQNVAGSIGLIATTGDVKWRPTNEILTGWVRINARTISNAGGGGSERANADVSALFTWVYNNFTNTQCPVSGGRGASAAADFAALKTIQLPDMRGRFSGGLDDMGNSAAGNFAGVPFTIGNATTPGAAGGEATHTLTIPEMPAHTHTAGFTQGIVQGGSGASGGATINTGSTGGGGVHNNTPLFMLGTWYVKL